MSKNIFYIFTTLVLSIVLSSGVSHAQDYMDDYTTTPSHESELDYDGVQPGGAGAGAWHSFGCQWVDYDEDRVIFHVNGNAGRFKKVRVKVGNNKPYYINVRILTYDGFKKRFHVEADASFPGEAITVQFSDIPRRIKKISLKYDARMRPGDRAKICMSGQKVQKTLRPKSPPVAKSQWKKLGCIKAKKGFRNTYVRVGEAKGRFKELRLFVHNAPAMIDDLTVSYEDGQKESLLVNGYVSANRYSRIYRLRKGTRISVIDITSRSRSLFRVSTICFHGLAYPAEKKRYAERTEPYENIPRSEEELLDDEQYLRKKPGIGKNQSLPKKSDQNGDLVALERKRKAAERQAELEKQAQQQRIAAEKKKAELLAEQRAIGRKRLEEQAALKREKQRQLIREREAQKRKKALANQQDKQDEEAFRKAQEKADKAQQESERLATAGKQREQALAEEKAVVERAQKAAELAKEKERQRIESLRLAKQLARQKELAAEQQAKEKAESERLAELKRLAAKRLAEKNKIHSKKGDFPKSKISPDKTGWITYGCQFFGSKIETRFIPVGRLQGTFTKIRVNVTGNSLTMKKMYVVYGNGREEPLIRYSSRVKTGGKTSDYTLSHMRRFISEVKIKAQSRDRGNDEKAMVCLEAYR